MPYNFAAGSFYTQITLCSRLFSSEVRFQTGLRATHDDHFRLIGKRVVDFLLVLIELFFQVLRLRRYERISVENRRFRSSGCQLTLNFTQNGSTSTNHSSSQKTRLNVLLYGIKISTDLSSVLLQFTSLTDRRTQPGGGLAQRQRVGLDQRSSPTSGPVNTAMCDHVRVQFPVRDIYLGMIPATQFNSAWPSLRGYAQLSTSQRAVSR